MNLLHLGLRASNRRADVHRNCGAYPGLFRHRSLASQKDFIAAERRLGALSGFDPPDPGDPGVVTHARAPV